MNKDCLFCKIIWKEIPTDFIYEDDLVFKFNDIYPQAPKHILVIPKIHIATLNDLKDDQAHIVGEMVKVSKNIAIKQRVLTKMDTEQFLIVIKMQDRLFIIFIFMY